MWWQMPCLGPHVDKPTHTVLSNVLTLFLNASRYQLLRGAGHRHEAVLGWEVVTFGVFFLLLFAFSNLTFSIIFTTFMVFWARVPFGTLFCRGGV